MSALRRSSRSALGPGGVRLLRLRQGAEYCCAGFAWQGLPLWLAVPFRGHVLWAINADHLTFMENYVAASLRETGPGNSRLASRLPAWIKSAKNRDDILRSLALLRAKLDG
jgi:hypothetical protein